MAKIFAPGPVDLPEIVKQELLVDPPYFGDVKFHRIIEKIQPQLRRLFQTVNPVLLCTGSGSLLMEQVILNFFSPNSKVVFINNGRYGKNWIECAKIHGLWVKEIKADLSTSRGVSRTSEEIDTWLKHHPDTEGVFCQHVETTTGLKVDVKAVAASVRRYTNAIFVVDAISSFLSERIWPDEWDVDVVLVSSQKGLSLPPGLGLLSVSSKAIEFAKRSTLPKYYFNVLTEIDRQIVKHQTRFTPATQIIMCLSKVLDTFETIDSYFLDELSLLAYTRSEVVANSLFVKGPFIPYSDNLNNTITVALFPEDIPVKEFFKILENRYNYIAGKGNDFLKDRVIRIRTFGWDLERSDVEQFLKAVNNTLEDTKAGRYWK